MVWLFLAQAEMKEAVSRFLMNLTSTVHGTGTTQIFQATFLRN
ncbi:MAG: hypothetical protein QF385_08295 [SAR324 cluster bacterium]|nr:hypothetical protein [SAR324 cluster bacterium]